jgi:acetyl-CoA C-acetyltransferase
VDLVFLGNARPAGLGPNPARQVAWRAGLPPEVPATTVNMACGSGLQAILLGVAAIETGRARTVIAGGFESMSNVPYLLPKARSGYRIGHAPLIDAMYQDGFECPLAEQLMGETAETLAREYGIARREQDEYALASHLRAAAAQRRGDFATELVAVPARGRAQGLTQDEHVRADTTLEKLAQLPAVFAAGGTISAGNSSGLTDAAAAVVLVRADDARPALARIEDYEVAGVDPKRMGLGPVPATRRLLDRNGLRIDDMAQVEINEAFAAQVLACARELALDPARTNPRGGAIALGHPIAASGARITTTLVHGLRGSGGLGLATLCVSGGMGVSLLLRDTAA